MNISSASGNFVSTGISGSATSAAASFLTATAALTTITYPRGAASMCVVINKTGVPEWYVNRIVRPFEEAQCRTPAIYAFNATFLVLINRSTGAQIYDFSPYCWNEFVIAWSRFQATHFFLFHDVPFAAATLGWYGNRYIMLVQYLSLYCAPIAVTIQVFGVRVMRNVLKHSDSAHLFIFHAVLVVVDLCLYLFSAAIFAGLGILFVFPGCLSYFMIAQGVLAYSSLLGRLFIDQLYCLANLIQALLALDRVLAVFFPVDYRVYATARTTVLAIVGALALNTAVSIFELLFNFYHGIAIWRLVGVYGPVHDWIALVGSYAAYMRLALFAVAYFAQLVGCVAVFLKIRWAKHHPVLREGKTSNISLLPCYLLIGTCGINLFGTVIEVLAFMFRSILTTASLSSAGRALFDVMPSIQQAAIPLFNNAGIWIHFIACRQYRAEAARLLAQATALLQLAFPCCCRGQAGGVVVPLAEASSGSGAAPFVMPTSSGGTASTSARSQQSAPGASMAGSSMAAVE